MLPQQKRIFRIFFGVILAVNVWGALPSCYKMPYKYVDPDSVIVYEPHEPVGRAPLIPIKRMETRAPFGSIDTGRTVIVTITAWYQDRGRQNIAVATLLLAVVGLAFYKWTGKRQIARG
jgi:hypothetical protein